MDLELNAKCHIIPDAEHDFQYYIAFPDGLRLIYRNGNYVGHYNALTGPID